MDPQHFDRLVKALTDKPSRRSVLTVLLGAAALEATARTDAALGKPKKARSNRRDEKKDPTKKDRERTQGDKQKPRGGGQSSGANAEASVATAVCPQRVRDPNYVPSANDCGSGWTEPFVPEKYKKAVFTPACTTHDLCYGTCNSTQAGCDEGFLDDLIAACHAAYPKHNNQTSKCIDRARVYFQAVSDFGGDPWSESQAAACICCTGVERACDNEACCNPCQECSDGLCLEKLGVCPSCSLCNPATGGCDPIVCSDPCDECVEGSCRPKTCDPCQACDSADGKCHPDPECCIPACGPCERCDAGNCVAIPDCCDPPCGPCEECSNGVCNYTCALCQVCSDGVCVACPAGTSCCNGVCHTDCPAGSVRNTTTCECVKGVCGSPTTSCSGAKTCGATKQCVCRSGSGGTVCTNNNFTACSGSATKPGCSTTGCGSGYRCVAVDKSCCPSGEACAGLCAN